MSGSGRVSWESVSLAIALLTAEHSRSGDDQALIFGAADRDEVIAVLALMTGTFLREPRGRRSAW